MGMLSAYVSVDAIISGALLFVLLGTLPLLLCSIVVFKAVRGFIAVCEFGTMRLGKADLTGLTERHRILRLLSAVTTVLALLAGAMYAQLALMSAIGCNCRPVNFSPEFMFH